VTCTLGVDVGTYETKGVLADVSGGIVAQAAVRHDLIVPRPGWAEHRAEEDWWGGFKAVTKSVLSRSGVAPGDIACVAVSGIGPCMLPVDASGMPLMNAVLYGVDTRAAAEIGELTEHIGEETLLARCGNVLTSQSVGPKILWLRRNRPEMWEQTAHIHSCPTHLIRNLTGETVIDHYTAAGFTPLYDVTALEWTAALADIIPLEKLPRLLWSAEIAGHVTEAAAAETGLAAGTPVTAGTIDAAAEAISVGVHLEGDMMMMYGSTVFIIQITPGRVRDPALWYAPWLFPGQHAAMAGLATSGTLTHWFRDTFARELDRESAFPTLVTEAETVPPGARGLIALPYFSGERTPIHDPKAKGAFFGLNLTHGRAEMFRAVLEGIAMGTAHVIDTFRNADAAPKRILAVGGGTGNHVWLQATSDIGQVPQIVCEKTIGASYGNAFLAALAIGAVSAGDISVWNPASATITPQHHDTYSRQYPLFLELYRQTRDISHALDG